MDVGVLSTVVIGVGSALAGLMGGIYQGRAALAKAEADRESAVDVRTNQLLDRLTREVDDLRAGRDEVNRRSQDCEVARAVLEERVAGQQRQIDRLVIAANTAGTPVVEVRADKAGIVVDVSDGITALLGYRVAQVVGRPLHNLLPPEFREQHKAAYDAANANQDPKRRQWRPVNGDALHADGTRVPVVVVVQQVRDGYRGHICPLTPQLPV